MKISNLRLRLQKIICFLDLKISAVGNKFVITVYINQQTAIVVGKGVIWDKIKRKIQKKIYSKNLRICNISRIHP